MSELQKQLVAARNRPGFTERLRRRLVEDKTILDRLEASDDRLIRPLLVQFYRCGAASQGRGWQRCQTPETCTQRGCERAGRDS